MSRAKCSRARLALVAASHEAAFDAQRKANWVRWASANRSEAAWLKSHTLSFAFANELILKVETVGKLDAQDMWRIRRRNAPVPRLRASRGAL